MLRTYGWVPRWRIVFSTFFRCMSFHTARVKSGLGDTLRHVRSTPESERSTGRLRSPLTAISRHHSITSSAVESSDCGIVMPSALAVFRLIASSYLVGACTGRSDGFSPLRMRST